MNANEFEWYQSLSEDDGYWVEDAKIGFAVEIERSMARRGINKRQLASNIGSSPAYVTKILSGDSNLTIESMVKLALAVGGDLNIHISPRHSKCIWRDLISNPQLPREEDAMAVVWAKQKKSRHGSAIPLAA